MYKRQGYGFESASKLLDIGFKEFGLKKVSAITTKENISSQKLIEKLGLRFQKTVQLPDDDVELLYYEIEKDSL